MAHPGAEVQVWAQDEARYGLIPTVRRTWACIGKRPPANGRRRYQWGYMYGFVEPETGRLFNLFADAANTYVMSAALQEFAEFAGLGPQRHAVLVLDNAGWHRSHDLEIPEGIHLCFLPAYSPELQPAERIWPLINEVVANRAYRSLEELEVVVGNRNGATGRSICCYQSALPLPLVVRWPVWVTGRELSGNGSAPGQAWHEERRRA